MNDEYPLMALAPVLHSVRAAVRGVRHGVEVYVKNKPTRKRLLSIARRMLVDRNIFYTTSSPRMSVKEYNALCDLGFSVQSEWPHPPESRMFYMMAHAREKNVELYEILNGSTYGGLAC